MQKIYSSSLILFLLILTGCASRFDEITPIPQPSGENKEVISIEEALEQLNSLQHTISKNTRSGANPAHTLSIRDIAVSGGGHATRSEGCDLPDTMVYVVNFADDRGFAILGARRSLEPVYAVTEAGSFDAGKLDDAIARAQTRRHRKQAATRAENNDGAFTDIGPDFVYELLGEHLAAAPRIVLDTIITKTGEWQTNKVLGPLVEVKWGQAYPFNKSMPLSEAWNYGGYAGRYPVGCSMVAVAQTISHIYRPAMAPALGGGYYEWDLLKTVSNYTNAPQYSFRNYPGKLSGREQINMSKLSESLYLLGVFFKVSHSSSGTGLSIQKVLSGLKAMDYFYSYASISTGAPSKTIVQQQMNENTPIIITGWQTEEYNGHTWIIDGFLERRREVTKSLVGTYKIWTEWEFSHFQHINWGWQGSSDGYFNIGIFDASQRDSIDNTIDGSTTGPEGTNYYRFYFEFITY